MILLLKKLHRYWYFISVLLVFLLFFPYIYFLARRPEKNYARIARMRRWVSVGGSALAGVFFKVSYESKKIDWNRSMVLCPNHTSVLDITALTYLCPAPFSFIGKASLLKNPVTRIFFKTIDIPVTRRSKVSSFKAFQRANELVRNGRSVVIFPVPMNSSEAEEVWLSSQKEKSTIVSPHRFTHLNPEPFESLFKMTFPQCPLS